MIRFCRLVSLILVFVMVTALIGCAEPTAPSGDSSYQERPALNKEEKVEHTDNDHLFDYKTEKWAGPEGYVIIVPDGNAAAKKSANLLKSYYKDALNINLAVKTDKTEETDKEILIGLTNRADSNPSFAENELAVTLNGEKLVFSAGHDVTVDTAVKKFIRLAPKKISRRYC